MKSLSIAFLSDSYPTEPHGIAASLRALGLGLTHSDIAHDYYVCKIKSQDLHPHDNVHTVYERDIQNIAQHINSTHDIMHIYWGLFVQENIWIFDLLEMIDIPIISTIASLNHMEYIYFQEATEYFLEHSDDPHTVMQEYEQWRPVFKLSADKQKQLFQVTDHLVFVSHREQELYQQYIGIDTDQSVIHVIHNGDISTLPENWNMHKNKHLGIFSRIEWRKGIHYTLQAFEQLESDFDLTIHGRVDTYGELLLSESSRAQYQGVLQDQHDIQGFFDSIDLLLCISLYEPCANAPLESLGYGVFPILGKNNGTVEVFGDVYPFVADSKNIDDIKNTIYNYYYTSENELQDIAYHTIEHTQRFSRKHGIQKYITLYQEIV